MQTGMLNLHQQALIWKGLKKAVAMHKLDEWLQKQSTAVLDLESSPAARRFETLAGIPQSTILMFRTSFKTKHI